MEKGWEHCDVMIITNMAAASSEEKGLLGSSRYKSHRRYGSTTVNMKKPEHVIRHRVSQQDTLQGIALRYGVTMELVKQHNRLWSSEAMFLHDYLEVPVTKEVMDAFTSTVSCPATPTANNSMSCRVSSPELLTSRGVGNTLDNCSEEGGGGVSPSRVNGGSAATNATSPAASSPTPSSFDYSDTRPCDFLSKIDSNIALMRTSIQRLQTNKYDTMDQMEVDDSSRVPDGCSKQPSHRTNSNGFPVRNGNIINPRNSRFVNSGNTRMANGRANNYHSSNNGSISGFGGCFSINAGYVCDPGDGSGGLSSPTAPPTVAVVGGSHNSYHNQPAHNGVDVRPSATRTITMSLKRLLRDQDDFCPL
uniref:Lysin motif-containing protein n=1 Tax=Hirondellea gigas TaxID=1518452 RepID=A0A6A7FUB7_9CRUS